MAWENPVLVVDRGHRVTCSSFSGSDHRHGFLLFFFFIFIHLGFISICLLAKSIAAQFRQVVNEPKRIGPVHLETIGGVRKLINLTS